MTTAIEVLENTIDVDIDMDDSIIMVTVGKALYTQPGQDTVVSPRLEPEMVSEGVICKLGLSVDALNKHGKIGIRFSYAHDILHPSVKEADVYYSLEAIQDLPILTSYNDGKVNGLVAQLDAVINEVPDISKPWAITSVMCFCLPMSYLLSPIIAGKITRHIEALQIK